MLKVLVPEVLVLEVPKVPEVLVLGVLKVHPLHLAVDLVQSAHSAPS